MNAAQALHTAARQFCMDRFEFWCARYSQIAAKGRDRERDDYHYTPEALATFPRYNVLRAIRVELERIEPATLDDVDKTRDLTLHIGRTAEDAFTRPTLGPIAATAISEERTEFCEFVRGLSRSELSVVALIPYRRVLADAECKELWSRICDRWQITDHYWYPLTECTRSDVVALRASQFENSVSPDRLQSLLASRGVNRVWEIPEDGVAYEQDLSFFVPRYTGNEGYWSSGDLGWIVYASHEDSITIGGWLLQELDKIWPGWRENLWVSEFT